MTKLEVTHKDPLRTSLSSPLLLSHLPSSECPSSNRLSISTSVQVILWFSPVEYLEEVGYTVPHPRMRVCLGTLDVVVEIRAEQLDMGNGLRSRRRVGEVTREQHFEGEDGEGKSKRKDRISY